MSIVVEVLAVQSELLSSIARDLRDAADRWPWPGGDSVDRVRRAAQTLEDIAGCERGEVARRMIDTLTD